MVASRWPWRLALAASTRRCTSSSVRYSRVRTSAFLGRTGMTTVRFTMAEGMVLTADLAMFCSRFEVRLFEEELFYEQKKRVFCTRPLATMRFVAVNLGHGHQFDSCRH